MKEDRYYNKNFSLKQVCITYFLSLRTFYHYILFIITYFFRLKEEINFVLCTQIYILLSLQALPCMFVSRVRVFLCWVSESLLILNSLLVNVEDVV